MDCVVIVKSGDAWWDDIALNYSQLSIDHSVSSRYSQSNYDYCLTDEFNSADYTEYDRVLIIQAGTILVWGNYEKNIIPKLKKYENINICSGANVWQPMGDGDISLDMNTQSIDPTTVQTFINSHSAAVTNLIDDSNISYLMHNELPKYSSISNKIDWAVTVSSGFFINGILNHHGIHSDTIIHHMDISKISLAVRKYTIQEWNGTDIKSWIKHLQQKYPSMQLFNRHKFTDRDNDYMVIWKNLQAEFADWSSHWKQYQSLEHHYHRVNISNKADIDKLLSTITPGAGVIWWNGALKRMPGNLLKDSDSSHQSAIQFVQTIAEHNPNTICYGSDHCSLQFNGELASTVAQLVAENNSRELLWQKK